MRRTEMTTNFTEQQRQILSIVLFEQVGKSSEGEQMDKETLELYKEIVNQKIFTLGVK
jgi:hypothetical protein